MFADKILINRRNVCADVKKKYNACKQFFFLEVEARILAATMQALKIKSLDETPTPDILPADLCRESSLYEKKTYLDSLALEIVNEFVVNESVQKSIIMKQKYNDWLRTCNPTTEDGRFKCRLSTCSDTFKHDGKIRKEHEKLHGFHHMQTSTDEAGNKRSDDVRNYQCSLLEYGMLQMNFHDAISEGDGARVLRCWKFMLPYLRKDGASSRKYALEGLYLLFQVNTLLPPKDAYSLIWNRFHKSKLGLGGNIPLDMALEHFNLLVKTVLRKLGSNVTNKKAIDRLLKALTCNKALLDKYDTFCGVIKRSGKHYAKSSENDLKKVAAELVSQNAMEFIPGRRYKSFPSCNVSLLEDFSIHDFYSWINEHKKNVNKEVTAR